jgi:type II secretory pathway pseudopilin PulG
MNHSAEHTESACSREGVRGFTLVEQMIAGVILVVAALGALSYQYYAIGQARVARGQIAATHTAQLLLEDWKSTGGSDEYDPASLGLGFSLGTVAVSSLAPPDGIGETLNDTTYAIQLDDIPVLAMLAYLDVDHDAQAKTTLRQLSVVARFADLDAAGNLLLEGRFAEMPSMTFVTYVRLDASSG